MPPQTGQNAATSSVKRLDRSKNHMHGIVLYDYFIKIFGHVLFHATPAVGGLSSVRDRQSKFVLTFAMSETRLVEGVGYRHAH